MAGLPENNNNPEDFDLDHDDLLNDFSLDDINLDDIDIGADDSGAQNNENIDLSLEDELTIPEEDLDITRDLGLQENLSMSKDETDDMSSTLDDINLDIIENNNDEESFSSDFYGVALKEGPKTIISMDSSDIETENDLLADYNDDNFDKNFEEDQEVVNFNFPDKNELSVDEDEEEYLKQDIDPNLTSDIDILDQDFGQETDLIEDSIHKNYEDNSLVSDEELMGLESDVSNIEEEEPSVTTIAEDEIPLETEEENKNTEEYKDISLDEELNYNEYDLHLDDESLSLDDIHLETDALANEDDTLELNLDEEFSDSHFSEEKVTNEEDDELTGREDSIETDLLDEDFDLKSIGTVGDDTLDETLDMEFKEDSDEIKEQEEIKSPFEEELSDDFAEDSEIKDEIIDTNDEDEKISIDNLEMEMIEEDFFPEDNEMPAIDEDILTETSDLDQDEINISPLNDSGSVFEESYDHENTVSEENNETDGDLSNIDLDDIPSPVNQKDESPEDETIGLSLDELDNILSTTDIIDNEEVTSPDTEDITLSAELPEETEDIDLSLSDEISLDEELDTGAVDIVEEPMTIKSPEDTEIYEKESETIDLDSFDADLNEESEATQEIIPEEPGIKQLNISTEEEDEIYNSLKSEMKTRDVEETDRKTEELKSNVKNVLSYLDQLLDALPEEKIKEFAESDTFEVYRKLFEELNIKNK